MQEKRDNDHGYKPSNQFYSSKNYGIMGLDMFALFLLFQI